MLLFFASVTTLFVITACSWHLFETRWDRKLFSTADDNLSGNISVTQAAALLKSPSPPVLLDVRSHREYDRGHLPGALHIAFSNPGFTDRLGSLDRTKPYLIYCAGGYRSRKTCGLMKELGFRRIYNLHRGILSWRLRGKAVEK